MESTHIDELRLHKHAERKHRTKRLMDMKDIKVLLAQNPLNLNGQPGGYRDMRYGFIARHRERSSYSNGVYAKIGNTILRAGSDDFDLVAHQEEAVSQIRNMGTDSPGVGIIIGANQPDLHTVSAAI
jgi:hypothetical protein